MKTEEPLPKNSLTYFFTHSKNNVKKRTFLCGVLQRRKVAEYINRMDGTMWSHESYEKTFCNAKTAQPHDLVVSMFVQNQQIYSGAWKL